jgi:large subunit ribosomal protein L19
MAGGASTGPHCGTATRSAGPPPRSAVSGTCGRVKEFMNQALLDKIESEQFRKQPLHFNVGDSVRVHTKVIEGDKERIQVFAGVVIGRRGRGLNETFTVRRISYGEGVERVFPVHSNRVEKVEVERQGSVRRAKLTYLRKRVGKGAVAVKEREFFATQVAVPVPVSAAVPLPVPAAPEAESK